jgi:hypothetical protein
MSHKTQPADVSTNRPRATTSSGSLNKETAMVRPHQPGQAVFKSVLPEDIEWTQVPAFPPSVRLAVVIGQPSEPGPYVIRVKVAAGVKLMPHRHPEDRVYRTPESISFS